MLGNDIVDWQQVKALNKSSNQRYLKKICCSSEIDFIQQSTEAELTLWQIWSLKEAAYKAAARLGAPRLFNPKKYEVQRAGSSYSIHSSWGYFEAITNIQQHYIHSIAWNPDVLSIHQVNLGIKRIDPSEDPSAMVRAQLLQNVTKIKGTAPDTFQIIKENNIPNLWQNNRKLDTIISLSHHGAWTAFCWSGPK